MLREHLGKLAVELCYGCHSWSWSDLHYPVELFWLKNLYGAFYLGLHIHCFLLISQFA